MAAPPPAAGGVPQWHLRPPNPGNPVVFFGEEDFTEEEFLSPPSLLERNGPPPPPLPRRTPPTSFSSLLLSKHARTDITIGGAPAGRVQMELFADLVPKTAENFRQFCTGEFR